MNRAYVHREAQLANLIVVDRGDRCLLLPKAGPRPQRDIPIDYSGEISATQKALDEAKKALRELHQAHPPTRRHTPPPPGFRQQGRSYAEAAQNRRPVALKRHM